MDRGPAQAGNFKRTGIQRPDASVPAAGAFGKNNQIASGGEPGRHLLHGRQHEIGQGAAGGRREVTGKAQHPPVQRNMIQPLFGNGGVLRVQGDEVDGVQIGDVVGNDHCTANALYLALHLPLTGRHQTLQQKEKPAVEAGIETLEGPADILRKEPCPKVKGCKKQNESNGVIGPQDQCDGQTGKYQW